MTRRDDSAPIEALGEALVRESLAASDYTPIFASFCDRLAEAGVPIFRVLIVTTTLHPMADGVSIIWRRDGGVRDRMLGPESEDWDEWNSSPLKAMLDAKSYRIRFRKPSIAEASARYPLIKELAAEGLTDYFGLGMAFSEAAALFDERDGLLASFSSDAPDGFSDADIEALERLMPRFGLIVKLANRERLFSNVLDAYLGPDAGRHVREGQIALGSGGVIEAVIWFCDLRNSVGLAKKLGHQGFIDLLNDYFAAVAGSVLDSGGQVLRFVGDAALAIFPIAEDGMTEADAKACAMQAVERALQRAAATNATRRDQGLDAFEFGIGLHLGRIMYGNIGVPQRVEFSVIGEAANAAARIQGLCKRLGETVLVSETFRQGCDRRWRDLGLQDLRGGDPIRVFAPD